jgi:hypothetical protein
VRVARRRSYCVGVGVVVAAAFALVASSCGEPRRSADAHLQAPPVEASTTTSFSDSARADAIEAYDAMWQDMAAVALTADYQSPRLAQHAAGDALSLLTRGVYTNRRRGVVVRGRPATRPAVTSLKPSTEPTTATIRDCFNDTNWLNYIAKTGRLQNHVPGGLHRTTATVKDIGGTWKVTELQVGAAGTC